MLERFRVVCIPYKALCKCSDLPYHLYFLSMLLCVWSAVPVHAVDSQNDSSPKLSVKCVAGTVLLGRYSMVGEQDLLNISVTSCLFLTYLTEQNELVFCGLIH